MRVVAPGAELEFMRQFALADIPFVGPKFQERLGTLGLRTVVDVLRYERATLVGWLGQRAGRWLHERVRGIDHAPVEPNREPRSISRDETFPQDLADDAALAARLRALADRAAADLREVGLLARTVTVKLRDADFTTRQASRTLSDPVHSERVVYEVARDLLRKLRAAHAGAVAGRRRVAAGDAGRDGAALLARRGAAPRDGARPHHLPRDRRGAGKIRPRRARPRPGSLTTLRDVLLERFFGTLVRRT